MEILTAERVILVFWFLFFVEAVVFHKWSYAVLPGKLVVLLRAVSRIGDALPGVVAVQALVFFQMLPVSGRVRDALMQGVVCHHSVIHRDLRIVRWFTFPREPAALTASMASRLTGILFLPEHPLRPAPGR